MKKQIFLVSNLILFLTSCAGREAYPVPMVSPYDSEMSCMALNRQMNYAVSKINRLGPQRSKFTTNVFWFIVFPPLMDVKDAEKVEYEAWQTRLSYLEAISLDKGCFYGRRDWGKIKEKEIDKIVYYYQDGKTLEECRQDYFNCLETNNINPSPKCMIYDKKYKIYNQETLPANTKREAITPDFGIAGI